jgi:hypothetical protein
MARKVKDILVQAPVAQELPPLTPEDFANHGPSRIINTVIAEETHSAVGSDGKANPVTASTDADRVLIAQFTNDMVLRGIQLVSVKTNDFIGEGVQTHDIALIRKYSNVPVAFTIQDGKYFVHPILRKRTFPSE